MATVSSDHDPAVVGRDTRGRKINKFFRAPYIQTNPKPMRPEDNTKGRVGAIPTLGAMDPLLQILSKIKGTWHECKIQVLDERVASIWIKESSIDLFMLDSLISSLWSIGCPARLTVASCQHGKYPLHIKVNYA